MSTSGLHMYTQTQICEISGSFSGKLLQENIKLNKVHEKTDERTQAQIPQIGLGAL